MRVRVRVCVCVCVAGLTWFVRTVPTSLSILRHADKTTERLAAKGPLLCSASTLAGSHVTVTSWPSSHTLTPRPGPTMDTHTSVAAAARDNCGKASKGRHKCAAR